MMHWASLLFPQMMMMMMAGLAENRRVGEGMLLGLIKIQLPSFRLPSLSLILPFGRNFPGNFKTKLEISVYVYYSATYSFSPQLPCSCLIPLVPLILHMQSCTTSTWGKMSSRLAPNETKYSPMPVVSVFPIYQL